MGRWYLRSCFILVVLCGMLVESAPLLLSQASELEPGLALKQLEDESTVESFLGQGASYTPDRFMVIVDPATDQAIRVRARALRVSGVDQHEGKLVFAKDLERWGPAKLVKRYNVEEYDKLFETFRGPDKSAQDPLFVFNQMDHPSPAKRLAERTLSVASLRILRYPQTWVNIWERYVLPHPIGERLSRVREFDERFSQQIENADAIPDWFSPVEQSAYARFYQDQFAHSRNARPQDPRNYYDLAELHRARGNVDAELSVYLDAIRNEVPEPDVLTFRLRVGQIMTKRLRLYEEALPHLEIASALHARAHLLLIECYHELGERSYDRSWFDKELAAADHFVELIDSDRDADIPSLEYPSSDLNAMRDQALLFTVRALVHQDRLSEAFDVFEKLSSRAEAEDEGQYLLASMYLYVYNYVKAVETIEGNQRFASLLSVARSSGASADIYDPLAADALCVWCRAQAELQGKQGDMTRIYNTLSYATTLDPLSVEPYIVWGRAFEIAGLFPDAVDAYRRGLQVHPDEARLNYALGFLNQRAGVLDVALNYYNAVLQEQPQFYAAMNRLAEIMLEREKAYSAAFEQAARADEVDADARSAALLGIAQSVREATAHYSSSLDINDAQSAVRCRLAGLYTKLASLTTDRDLLLSYLESARNLAQRGIEDVEVFAQASRSTGKKLAAHIVAAAPPLEAYSIYAYASYEIGRRSDRPDMMEDARQKLQRLMVLGQDPRSFPSSAQLKAFRESSSFVWARETLSAIEANERQQRKRDLFQRSSTDVHSLGNRWLPFPRGLDANFTARIDGSELIVAVNKQREAGQVSRIGLQERFTAVSSMRVVIPKLGEGSLARGIHITRLSDEGGAFTGKFDWSLMVGFDADNQLIWEVRSHTGDKERSLMLSGRPEVIDQRFYGGEEIEAGDSVELEIRRYVPEPAGPTVFFEVSVNGHAIRLDLRQALHEDEREALDSTTFLEAYDDDVKMAIGFFTSGPAGGSGELRVAECEWVLDSNLARREE